MPLVLRRLVPGLAVSPLAMAAVLAPVAGGDLDVEVDYLEVVDAATLQPVEPLAGEVRLLAAVRFGRARLLDNTGGTIPAPTA